jgi:hypothetical protein
MFPVVGAGLGNGPGRMEVFGIEGYIRACWLAGYESRVVAEELIVVRAADDLKPVVGSRLGMPGFSALHTAELTGPLCSGMANPDDDFLLALTEAGKADYLVTGDKAGLLPLRTHRGTRIVTARVFVGLV